MLVSVCLCNRNRVDGLTDRMVNFKLEADREIMEIERMIKFVIETKIENNRE